MGNQGLGPPLLWVGAWGRGAPGPIGSIPSSCKYRDMEEWKWGEGTRRDLEYEHRNIFLWGQSGG